MTKTKIRKKVPLRKKLEYVLKNRGTGDITQVAKNMGLNKSAVSRTLTKKYDNKKGLGEYSAQNISVIKAFYQYLKAKEKKVLG